MKFKTKTRHLLLSFVVLFSLCSCTATQKTELRADGKAVLKTVKGVAVKIAEDELQAYLESLITK